MRGIEFDGKSSSHKEGHIKSFRLCVPAGIFLFNFGVKRPVDRTDDINTVDSRYLDFGYLEQPLISKRKSDLCFNIEI